MKLSGLAGKGSGKLGSNVYAVSGGEQIVRQYNPVVANPSTPAQVAQRSRLKLASQIAAAMADVIAIPKSGLVSSRNAFMKRNFDLIVGSENGASCQYSKLQLTGSAVGLPAVNAEKSDAQTLSIELASDATAVASRVIYNVFAKTTEQQLMLIASRVVTEAGENGTFPLDVTTSATELVVYAYGMRDMSSTASAKYGNYHVQSGEDIAKLVANRKLSAADFTFTQTQGFDLIPWENPFPGTTIQISTADDDIDINTDDLDSNTYAVGDARFTNIGGGGYASEVTAEIHCLDDEGTPVVKNAAILGPIEGKYAWNMENESLQWFRLPAYVYVDDKLAIKLVE